MNSFKSVNLISLEKQDISIEEIFKNSLSIEGVARTGKTTLLFHGLESKIKENKKILFIQKRDEISKLKELSLKYDREKDFVTFDSCEENKEEIKSILKNENKIISLLLNDIKQKDEDETIILSILIDLYSDLKENELYVFIDEKYDISNSPLLEKLISISHILKLNFYIVSNDLTPIFLDNISQNIYFKINDKRKIEEISTKLNINNNLYQLLQGTFIFHKYKENFLCSFN